MVQEKLWLPQPMMYAEQHRFQPHHHQQYESYRESQSNAQFQYSSKPNLSHSLDPDSIMKVHDDLPSAAILAWERLKAKNERLRRNKYLTPWQNAWRACMCCS